MIAAGALIVVHQKFMKYGGPKNYGAAVVIWMEEA